MKAGLLTFTYGGDEGIFRERMEVVEQLRKCFRQHEIHEFIADDANNPFQTPVEDNALIHYFRTDYDRKGNLNGIGNMLGQLMVMKRIQEEYDLDYIIKVDSDTCILNLNILSAGIDYGGSSETPEYGYGWGNAYFLSRKALSGMFRVIDKQPKCFKNLKTQVEQGILPGGEDYLTGCVVWMIEGGVKVDIKRMCESGALCPFHRFDELKGNHFAAATKVGNRFKYSEIDKKGTTSDIIGRMHACRKLLVPRCYSV